MSSLDGNFTYLSHSQKILLGSIRKRATCKVEHSFNWPIYHAIHLSQIISATLISGLSVMLEHEYYRQHELVDMVTKLGFYSPHSGIQVQSQQCSIPRRQSFQGCHKVILGVPG